jgi:hypothetical protein
VPQNGSRETGPSIGQPGSSGHHPVLHLSPDQPDLRDLRLSGSSVMQDEGGEVLVAPDQEAAHRGSMGIVATSAGPLGTDGPIAASEVVLDAGEHSSCPIEGRRGTDVHGPGASSIQTDLPPPGGESTPHLEANRSRR